MTPFVRRLVAGACASLLAACSSDELETAATQVTDSAGVTLVTSHAPGWSDGEEWKIDPRPSTQIGLRDVEPEQFLRIRRVRVRSDRSVAVLDGSSSELRVFDSSGAVLMILAGEGDGPGELRGPRELYVVSGDTMLVWTTVPGLLGSIAMGDSWIGSLWR